MKTIHLLILLVLGTITLAECGDRIHYDGRTYYLSYPKQLDWFQSVRYCATIGMYLVDLATDEEHNRIGNAIQLFKRLYNGTTAEHFWTSGTDLGSEGKFYWFTTGQSISYPMWHDGEPNNVKYANGEMENCLNVHYFTRWYDSPCSTLRNFICRDMSDVTIYKSDRCTI